MVLVGSSQVLELFSLMCFGFWLKLRLKRGKPAISTEIIGEYRY